ncbi:MAG: GTPase HflX, partial [Anaerolineaceae bacterium]
AQWQSVQETLIEIGAQDIPIITALNKMDRLKEDEKPIPIPNSIQISALTGAGVENLLRILERELFESFIPIKVKIPYQQGNLISLFHDSGIVENSFHEKNGVVLEGQLPERLIDKFEKYFVSNNSDFNQTDK